MLYVLAKFFFTVTAKINEIIIYVVIFCKSDDSSFTQFVFFFCSCIMHSRIGELYLNMVFKCFSIEFIWWQYTCMNIKKAENLLQICIYYLGLSLILQLQSYLPHLKNVKIQMQIKSIKNNTLKRQYIYDNEQNLSLI